MQVAHGLDHRERAAGERAGLAAGDPVVDLHVEITQAVRAVVEPGARDGVGHERDPALRCLPHHRRSDGRDVHPVEDQLDDDVGPRKRGADDTRVAVVERAHGVEEVRHAPHAEVEGGVRLLGRGVRVTGGDGDLAPDEPLDDLARARKLRGERDESDGPCVEESIEKLEIRIAAGGSWMDPQAQGREERPFEMHAQDAGPVRRCRHLAEGGEELRLGSGDERGEEGGHAGLEQRVARVAVALAVGGEEVDPGEAVDLEVDEARHGDPAAVRRREAEAGDTAAEDLDVARDERAVDEGGLDAEPHGAVLQRTGDAAAGRVEPGARRSGVDSREQRRRSRPGHLPSASASASSTSFADAPVAAPTIRRTRSWSFSFAATTSTMRFPYVLPRRIIEIVEIVLSTSFCAVPALRRVDPARNSGPDDDRDLVVDQRTELGG